jgi:hypothetical protein
MGKSALPDATSGDGGGPTPLLPEVHIHASHLESPGLMGKPTIAVVPGSRSSPSWSVWPRVSRKSRSLGANPRLSPDDIRAALAFASQVLHADMMYPVAANAA